VKVVPKDVSDRCRPVDVLPSDGRGSKGKLAPMSTVEVFTGSCRLCDAAVQVVKEAVAPCGCEVVVRSIDGDEARAYGLTAVPSVVKDGAVIFSRLPSLDEAITALREPRVS